MSQMVNIRVPEDSLAEIDRLAIEAKLSRTQYMIRASLGEPLDVHTGQDRLDELEERLSRLERLAYEQ